MEHGDAFARERSRQSNDDVLMIERRNDGTFGAIFLGKQGIDRNIHALIPGFFCACGESKSGPQCVCIDGPKVTCKDRGMSLQCRRSIADGETQMLQCKGQHIVAEIGARTL
jgi:hypothetical protein